MKKNDALRNLLDSFSKNDRHIVKVKIDTFLQGSTAVQYKLLRLLKNEDFSEQNFVDMILICGLAEINKVLLNELFSAKKDDKDILRKLFTKLKKAM